MSQTAAPAPDLAGAAGDFDVFLYLSDSGLNAAGTAAHLAHFLRRSGLAVEGRRITAALPGGAADPHAGFVILPGGAAPSFTAALRLAGADRRGLLVVRGAWVPGNETVLALTTYQGADPMISTVQPRFAAAADDRIIGLPGLQPGAEALLPRAALPYLPATFITPELPSPLLLLTPAAVLAVDAVPLDAFDAALGVLLVRLRRRGFRNLVCNRIVAALPLDRAGVYPPAIPAGHPWQADAQNGRAWLAAMPERGLEAILTDAVGVDGRARVLLDCRGLHDFYNGTSQAILGYLDGLAQVDPPGLEFTVMTSRVAGAFHELAASYPKFRIGPDRPEGGFLAAVRLDQPWDLHTIAELHAHAVFVVFNMLDTITWDIIFPAPVGLDQAWRLMPRLADGFLFISEYTRRRFLFRFGSNPGVPLVVTHLSLHREEVLGCTCATGTAAVDEPYILLFGNRFDHKTVAPTLVSLTDAFPFTRIVAIGSDAAPSPRVTALPSGRISEAEINGLTARAAVVVYPSHYEGFGLPVVHGLAHGRTVVVRRSPLWAEIAAHADLHGRLVEFADEAELVEAVGRAVHGGEASPALRIGAALAPGRGAPAWRDCARPITELLGELAFTRDGAHWIERQVMLNRRTLAEAAA
jgi:glycosyltransferase involved in cell wall biosynthesis